MAERLGTGLQNLLQRFDSAWHLQNRHSTNVGWLFLWIAIPNKKGRLNQEPTPRFIHEVHRRRIRPNLFPLGEVAPIAIKQGSRTRPPPSWRNGPPSLSSTLPPCVANTGQAVFQRRPIKGSRVQEGFPIRPLNNVRGRRTYRSAIESLAIPIQKPTSA